MTDEPEKPDEGEPLTDQELDKIQHEISLEVQDNLEQVIKAKADERGVPVEALREILVEERLEISGEMTSETFRGPLPHPQHLAQYEHIQRGAADRILAMSERQAEHNNLVRRKQQQADNTYRLTGLLIGFACLVLFLAAAGLFLFLGHEGIAAGLLSFPVLLGVLSLFIRGELPKFWHRAPQEKND